MCILKLRIRGGCSRSKARREERYFLARKRQESSARIERDCADTYRNVGIVGMGLSSTMMFHFLGDSFRRRVLQHFTQRGLAIQAQMVARRNMIWQVRGIGVYEFTYSIP